MEVGLGNGAIVGVASGAGVGGEGRQRQWSYLVSCWRAGAGKKSGSWKGVFHQEGNVGGGGRLGRRSSLVSCGRAGADTGGGSL